MEGKAQGSFQARRSPLYSPRNAGSPSRGLARPFDNILLRSVPAVTKMGHS
jgi:hypothetical protein